ncbi:hypothetical protein BFW01_g10008 [Lasiodiplodia theobromae]|nr:hypothetical protein BFW01_g10008 [Lasiodiplodia theobromae]
MARHRVEFNVDALGRAASRVSDNSPFESITKISEDHYHKCYELLMGNGKQLIAKIPLPHVSIPHLTCANQVATMDFARSTLKLPAPKVLDWNSRLGSENPVGAEYILMQKLPGVPFDTVNDSEEFGRHHLLALAKQIFELEKSLLGMTFRNIGSIYYKGDVTSSKDFVYSTPEGEEINDSRFVIGPLMGPQWVSNGRCTLECDRGPWTSAVEYLKAIVKRELQAVDTAPQLPLSFESILGPRTYRPTAAKKHLAGKMCLQLIEHIIPTPPSPISQYRLWHNLLSDDRILVDVNDPGKITGITGWHNAPIAPLFKQKIWPGFWGWDRKAGAEYGYEESSIMRGEDDEPFCEKDIWHELARELLHLHQKPDILHADRYGATTAGAYMKVAENLFDNDEVIMAYEVIGLQKLWKRGFRHVQKKSRGAPFPVKLTHRHVRRLRRDKEIWGHGYALENRVKWRVGSLWPMDGAIDHESYGETKDKLAECKKHFVDSGEIYEKDWPYDS